MFSPLVHPSKSVGSKEQGLGRDGIKQHRLGLFDCGCITATRHAGRYLVRPHNPIYLYPISCATRPGTARPTEAVYTACTGQTHHVPHLHEPDITTNHAPRHPRQKWQHNKRCLGTTRPTASRCSPTPMCRGRRRRRQLLDCTPTHGRSGRRPASARDRNSSSSSNRTSCSNNNTSDRIRRKIHLILTRPNHHLSSLLQNSDPTRPSSSTPSPAPPPHRLRSSSRAKQPTSLAVQKLPFPTPIHWYGAAATARGVPSQSHRWMTPPHRDLGPSAPSFPLTTPICLSTSKPTGLQR